MGGDYALLLPRLPDWDQLDFGALVGVVDVVDCVPIGEIAGDPFAVGPWCWRLANASVIKPRPWKGQVSFFDVPLTYVRHARAM